MLVIDAQFRRWRPFATASVLGSLIGACTGSIPSARPSSDQQEPADDEGVGGAGGASGGGGGTSDPISTICKVAPPPPGALRRLSRLEYANTLRDLLGQTVDAAALPLPPEAKVLGFDHFPEAQTPSPALVEAWDEVAASVATKAAANLQTLLGCTPGAAPDDACLRTFVRSFGRRAFRRPLTADEEAKHLAFLATGRMRDGLSVAVTSYVTAVLEAPSFLYRPEQGIADATAPGLARLDGWELASRLSYLFWASMPDEPLFEAAAKGALATPEGLAAEAERLLRDPRARPAVTHFFDQWLEIEGVAALTKDAEAYPSFTPAVAASMARELSTFAEQIFFEGEATLAALYGADHTYVDRTLAAFYGMTAPPDGKMQKVSLRPGERRGVLTLGGIMAAHARPNQSSPIDRGKFLREKILCQPLPLPPNDVEIKPPEVRPGSTTRERFAQHTSEPRCAGCHGLIDPPGFLFEHYDGAGRFRTTDQGAPVNARGDLVSAGSLTGSYENALALVPRLAESEEVRSCMVTAWFRFGFARDVAEADACTVALMDEAFRTSGASLRSLLLALVKTPAFRTRAAGGAQ